MSKVRLWGFHCDRCGSDWAPRKPGREPRVCPYCKSAYWNQPRCADVPEDYQVTCKWKAIELDAKTVEYKFSRARKDFEGRGWLIANDLGNGQMAVAIIDPGYDPMAPLRLTQAEVDSIETHSGKYRFKILSRS